MKPFSKQVENTVRKGEISHFPSVFKRLVLQTRKSKGVFEKGKQIENTVRKGEIARYEQILLFTQCFQKTCNAETRVCLGKG